MDDSEAWPDDRFWVRLGGGWTPDPDLRWRINGNGHTHRGHFHVCAIGQDLHRTVNMGDVVETSPDAGVWLAGFLSGQEVDLFEFMGSSDELCDAADEADFVRWQRWNEEFRRLGYSPSPVRPVPPAAVELRALVDPLAWTYVADLYRVWRDGAWVVAEPQPVPTADRRGWTWPNTRCASRGHHSLEQIGSVTVCEDCHQVSW